MDRKRILWLASWYPNKNDHFDGDFIQRHARAAALYHDIHVIFVTEADISEPVQKDEFHATGLTEEVIYFQKRRGIFSKWLKQVTWRKVLLKAIQEYISKNDIPHLVHVQVPWKAGIVALELSYKTGTRILTTEHWGIYNHVVQDNYPVKSSIVRKVIKKIIESSALLISPSAFLADGINRMVVMKKYKIIPNVVDTTLFYYKEHKHPVFTFIHVSNMVPLKNVSGILQAFAELVFVAGFTDVQLILIGNRDNTYKKEAEHLGLLNRYVHFKGEISYGDVAREMQQAHCLILNSDMENSPCVIGEALCCGLPVIATRVGGIPELLDHTNSILITPREEKALSLALVHMMERYEEFNNRHLSEDARKKFSYDHIGMLHDEAYQECLGNP